MTIEDFDEKVFNAIARYGVVRLKTIVENVSDPCNGLAFLEAAHKETGTSFTRTVDKALQRLRRVGRIYYRAGRWYARYVSPP